MKNINGIFIAVLVIILFVLSILVFYYHSESVGKDEKIKSLDSEVNMQGAVISTQVFNFNRFNQIASTSGQYGINVKAKSEERQIEYRTIIKTDPVGRQCVVNSVADRLLHYTDSLRANSMHTNTGEPDTVSTTTASATCRLTYAQAVYWIDPLLATIDQLNNQLAGIRDIEAQRRNL